MKPIVTLTLNPSIDGAAQAASVHAVRKVRTSNERYDPGGGGINVSRVVRELGGPTFAVYLAGGVTGGLFDALLTAAAIPKQRIAIQDHTRISHAVFEQSSGLEFRFVPEGPLVEEAEWEACLEALSDIHCDYLVASGSLPRGVPEDFYASVRELIERKGTRLVLDTSGQALRPALDQGVHLVKPSLGELESLVGQELRQPEEQEDAVSDLVRRGAAEIVALTLGRDGALLATRGGVLRQKSPEVPVRSAVGAGDSFLAAMTLGLAEGRSPEDAFAYGMAAGAAAVLSPGTELCRREDVMRLYEEARGHSADETSPLNEASLRPGAGTIS
jgi:6-phosphofructokinase 2